MGGADGVLTLYEIGTERTPTEKVLLRLTLTLTLPLPLTLTLTLTLTQVLLRLSSYFGALPYISLYLPTSPYISLHLPSSAHQVLLRLSSYFGGLLCIAWSHDDRLLFTGGEDDLVSRVGVGLWARG